ncbi:MAG: bifunctional folylpolyglutamate synthase/dihydrofolate synthase [Desulfobulbaceae bacterium]|uniref:Dihydrofolate synthase/folylpolyglutamate synthase n=1 Tax=Candidatus Desulfobia pelagia TaxID=2841692 RepID=A0A8J6TAN8_9BACT|nr:bifunctional folylpolyglutamate synthase/dihydrofolate synthase [Candidatus Desulfobia pelagia]
MNYKEAWEYLDNLQFFKIKLGLESMAEFLGSVGNPQNKMRFVHVGGTNGKGSVSATLLTLLSEAGYKVGLYTSPHLSSVRERFRINDTYISENDFAEIATRIKNTLSGTQITYFEFTTALALLWFEQQKVDLAVMEVGLGGRLDATNVISPLVSVITNVSMDHEFHLGNTLTEVATEKAGIIKSGVPVVSGAEKNESGEVIQRTCLERGARLLLLERDFGANKQASDQWDYMGWNGLNLNKLPCHLKGQYQVGNAAMAIAACECLREHGFQVDDDSFRSGLGKVRWPGRLEHFTLGTHRFLLDGAHNPAGIESLTSSLKEEFQYDKLICVWASMSDKDISKTLRPMAPLCDHIIFTRPEAERSALTEDLVQILPEEYRPRAKKVESVAAALLEAQKMATPEDLICVAGSLYLIGAARKILLGELVI